MSNSSLGEALAGATPKDVSFITRHISTPATPCPALFSAPPYDDPEATKCENHFLIVSIDASGDEETGHSELLSFGIEILIYTTDRLTILFVSKADSTGCLQQLKLPPGGTSLIRSISTAFISYLVETHQRSGVRLVVSLFARAQNQYLFPGSVDNKGKHVLDDRGLVKWWCRVFDPVLRGYEQESKTQDKGLLDKRFETTTTTASAYLIVPGCDRFETRSFFPATAKLDTPERLRWLNSYPLSQIRKSSTAAPRCLIPRFPDDPKSRFLTDLDDEIPEENDTSPSKKQNTGQWKSVKSLEQFWEMMAFRQECSAGRLVGFLWMIINPPGLINSDKMSDEDSKSEGDATREEGASTLPPLGSSKAQDTTHPDGPSVELPSTDILPPTVQPTLETPSTSEAASGNPTDKISQAKQPEDEPLSRKLSEEKECRKAAQGTTILEENDYKVVIDTLAQLDFGDDEETEASTKSWIEAVSALVGRDDWSLKVTGKKELAPKPKADHIPQATNLITGGFIRKRKGEDGHGNNGAGSSAQNEGVTTLPLGLIRKKRDGDGKKDSNDAAEPIDTATPPSQGVNVLNANLVRKKKKI